MSKSNVIRCTVTPSRITAKGFYFDAKDRQQSIVRQFNSEGTMREFFDGLRDNQDADFQLVVERQR